ncbi:MAG: ABC transporter substrate-binding protein, partial [Alphaproteobacteria bacterium]|nr:ABC transporter substrate-binding protein [Alphaproteobacteria bacterium]
MNMKRRQFGYAAIALAAAAASARAEDKPVVIGVSIPAADHGWTGGVVYHANR